MKKLLIIPVIIISLIIAGKLFPTDAVKNVSNIQSIHLTKHLVYAGTESFITILIVMSAITSLVFTIFYNKRNDSKKKLADFKNNISLLRSEKLGSYNNLKLQNRRKKILNKVQSDEDNLKYLFTRKAKKLGIGTGDFILAARIQSSSKNFTNRKDK